VEAEAELYISASVPSPTYNRRQGFDLLPSRLLCNSIANSDSVGCLLISPRPLTPRLIGTTIAAKFIMIRCKPVSQSYSLHEMAVTAFRTARKRPQTTSTDTRNLTIQAAVQLPGSGPTPANLRRTGRSNCSNTKVSATTAPDNFTPLQNTSKKTKQNVVTRNRG
jgi:hypothetical protein